MLKRIKNKVRILLGSYANLNELALGNHNRLNLCQEIVENQEERIARIEKLVLGAAIDYATNNEDENYQGRERGES